jgi:phosphonate transport system substrate-binding protein
MPILMMLLILVACTGTQETDIAGYVNLSDLRPLPTPIEDQIRPLRVAIAAVISPKGSAESYALLLDYLSQHLDRPVERVQRRTYAEVNELLRTGEVDLGFVCTSSYLIGEREFDLQLLVAPQVNGEVVYRAQIIVPFESQAQDLLDLRNKVFAFTDPNSFSGRIYPTYLLQTIGEQPETFFSRTFFTYSHDVAIDAVADGIADGASVDSLVLDFALKRDAALGQRVRVIHTSPPFGMPPVVVSPMIRPQLRQALEELLLNMHLDSAGQSALQALGYDRFVRVSDEDYQTAREIENAVFNPSGSP